MAKITKTKKISETEEEIIQREIESKKREYISEPTRLFKENTPVRVGNLKDCFVDRVVDNGKIYVIRFINEIKDKPPIPGKRVFAWTSVLQKRNKDEWENIERLTEKDDRPIQYSNSSVSSILHYYYHAGIDGDTDYQRDLVWKLEEKQALIDSIFRNVEIGKFALMRRDYGVDGKLYEVIDGKQRINTLVEFFEDRFPYKGKYFSELHPYDQNHFEEFPAALGFTEKLTREQILKYFLKMNVAGVPQSQEHLNKVSLMLEGERSHKTTSQHKHRP